MAGARYIQQKRKRNSERGKYGNAVKAQMRMADAEESVVVATVRTSGSLGEHTIELLSCPDPMHVYVRCDGELRQPRTARGFTALLSKWIWKQTKGETT